MDAAGDGDTVTADPDTDAGDDPRDATGSLGRAVLSALEDYLAENYTDARTLWNSISRCLDDVSGVEKAGYGE